MTRHAVTIEIDEADLPRVTDERLALFWHVAQASPAPFGDAMAGELVEHIAREIVRRWLKGTEPELWHHQGRHHPHRWLTEFATWQPGEGYRPGAPVGDDENIRAFHSGRWVLKPTEDGSPDPGEDR
jgi:hypothetical protein